MDNTKLKSRKQHKLEEKNACPTMYTRPVGVIPELKGKTFEEVQKVYRENMNIDKVCCINLQSDANVGMIVRTASLFGMSEVIIIGKRKYDKRTTVGTDHYIPVTRILATTGTYNEELDTEKILSYIEECSSTHNIIFVENIEKSIDMRHMKKEITNGKPAMFVMGSEDKGIPEEVLKFKNAKCVIIPQKGVTSCFNVSIAFSIIATMYYYSA